jgi:hypothetical protein
MIHRLESYRLQNFAAHFTERNDFSYYEKSLRGLSSFRPGGGGNPEDSWNDGELEQHNSQK